MLFSRVFSMMTEMAAAPESMDTSKYSHREISDEIDQLNRQLEDMTEHLLDTRGNRGVARYISIYRHHYSRGLGPAPRKILISYIAAFRHMLF